MLHSTETEFSSWRSLFPISIDQSRSRCSPTMTLWLQSKIRNPAVQTGYLIKISDSGQLLPFGSENVAFVTPLTIPHVFRDIVISDNRIYVCGFAGAISQGDDISSFVACFDFDGNLDPAFSQDGLFEFDVPGKNTYLTTIGLESNGRIVAAGSQADEGTFAYEPFAMRLKTDGKLDISYGTNGSQLFSGILGFTNDSTVVDNQLYLTSIFNGQFGVLRINGGLDFVPGDVNGDNTVNLLDVAPFVAAIADGDYLPVADINCDNSVDLLDVAPFIELLAGG